ncbi:MAG TPA: hypothetical protein DCY50_02250 [Franconibacter helveticus]|uniref:hypothetical protein n=1 Tax=Franconibacter helveticus TaxID=357240 RepID=UPI00040A67A6|nr:hypothetical protein [Franconibacter helveticus]MDU6924192.1 hypothetical protein [Franconibacter helveticus]HAZ53864.1 hypothetical protein [Franconibacter helveticus]
MKRLFLSLFTSPEKLLQVISHEEIQDSIDDGDRILIDEDGNASVNIHCKAVQEDFARHIEALKRA